MYAGLWSHACVCWHALLLHQDAMSLTALQKCVIAALSVSHLHGSKDARCTS